MLIHALRKNLYTAKGGPKPRLRKWRFWIQKCALQWL